MKLAIPIITALLFLTPAVGFAQNQLDSHLQPLQFLLGEWEATYLHANDVPELGIKKGDKIETRMSFTPTLEGKGIELTAFRTIAGNRQPPSKEIIVWDANGNQIKHAIVGTNGFLGQGLWKLEEGEWRLHWSADNGDARYSGVSCHRSILDDSFVWHLVDVKKGDQAQPDSPEVTFRRVTPPHLEWIDYLAGTWEFELNDGRKGDILYKKSGDTPAITFTGQADQFSIAGVIGWHPAAKKFFETTFADQNGAVEYLQREFSKVSSDRLVGFQTVLGKGGRANGQPLEYHRIGNDEFWLSGKSPETGETDWTVKLKRKQKN